MKRFKDFTETTTGSSSSMVPQWLHKIAMKPKLKNMVRMYLDWRKKNPGKGRAGVQQAVKMMGLSPRDGNLLVDTLNDMVKKGQMPKHLAVEEYKYEWGTDAARKHAKKMTPGQNENKDPNEYDQEGEMAKTKLRTMIDAAQELHDMLDDDENMPEWVQSKITKATDYIDTARDYCKSKGMSEGTRGSTDAPKGPESYEAQYKRRLVKTTDPEHKKKGFNWRIKGKKNSSLTKKLYKNKPGQAEFNKQMRRIAGHEFG